MSQGASAKYLNSGSFPTLHSRLSKPYRVSGYRGAGRNVISHPPILQSASRLVETPQPCGVLKRAEVLGLFRDFLLGRNQPHNNGAIVRNMYSALRSFLVILLEHKHKIKIRVASQVVSFYFDLLCFETPLEIVCTVIVHVSRLAN